MDLLHEAALEASSLYPEFHDPEAPPPSNSPTPPRGAYFVAFTGSRPIGMGAHRPVNDEVSEVRRMFVRLEARNQGIARAVLQCVEEHAGKQGFTKLLLETGSRQLPAIRLYESSGFTRISAFGPYVNDPTSVCYEKNLSPAAHSEA
jgi:GNAT superfamily N-acetyltransferase